MPLVRIDYLQKQRPATYGAKVGAVVYGALREMGVPENDRFQIFTAHADAGLAFDATYLNVARSDEIVFIQITLNEGRNVEQKKKLYATIADGLQRELQLRREDVFVNLVEVKKDNWSFGNGVAQYAL